MLLNDAVKRVKDRSHRGDVDVTTDDITASILRALSDTKTELVRRIPRRKLWKQASPALVVVQGTATYSLASDVQEPIIFQYIIDGSLRLPVKIDSDREWFQQVFSPSTGQQDPTHYRELGPDGSGNRQIEFFPVPKQAITVDYEYYRKTNQEFVTGDLTSEIPDIPEQLHDAMWKGAYAKFLKGFDDPGQDRAKLDYDRAMLEYDAQEDEDHDTDLAMRFGLNRTVFNRPNFFNPQGDLQ